MSFVREKYEREYQPDSTVNARLLPHKYLPVNDYNISRFTNVEPWYQPEKKYNYTMIHTNGITNNKQYRDYLIKYSKEITDFNENLYRKHIIRS